MSSPYLQLLHKGNLTSLGWWASIPVVFFVWLFFYLPIQALKLIAFISKWLAKEWQSVISAIACETIVGKILIRFTQTKNTLEK